MSKQKATEEFLKALSGAVDEIIEENFGERVAFSLLLWPKNAGDKANYISNAPREEMIEALRETLLRWENNSDDRVDEVNPSLN